MKPFILNENGRLRKWDSKWKKFPKIVWKLNENG